MTRLDKVTDHEGKEKLRQDGQDFPPLKLNLGCGIDFLPRGVINVDCRNLIPPDGAIFLRADVADLADYFEDGCADEVWAHDVLEHFPQETAKAVLAGWVRLLAPGGLLHLRTPDLEALGHFLLQKNVDSEERALRVYGGQTYAENFHKAGFTIPYLTALLSGMGMDVTHATSDPRAHTNLDLCARKRGA